MAAPTLSTIQGILVALIEAAQAKAGNLLAGIPVARESFGFMDPTNDALSADKIVENALDDGGPGMAIFVSQPIGNIGSQILNGPATVNILNVVFLFVNPEQNERGSGGFRRNPLQVVQALWSAILGNTRGPSSFKLGPSPIAFSEDGAAIRTYPIDFECTLIV